MSSFVVRSVVFILKNMHLISRLEAEYINFNACGKYFVEYFGFAVKKAFVIKTTSK